MKLILCIILLILPCSVGAEPKLWFSNKFEVGYDKVFVGEKVTIDNGVFVKSSLCAGLKFKLSDSVQYKTFYLLQNSKKQKWANEHFLGAEISFKMK